ncbi:alpha-glucuronidase [Paenalkalicoccus suaedae]|uniref:Xylan alpha-1,2-glucuronidase n=1 Tax=Paenalkalicoccus suaedae TaxID=2592382 RepID=A0A859FJI1_9BACI|nr:alpha-glucuronidase family glycosyl hydrolase [Paenalkalicoccus suaedae]QKS72962.1 alpha-glucuronidase [Paenalkalicoccus suaedae]
MTVSFYPDIKTVSGVNNSHATSYRAWLQYTFITSTTYREQVMSLLKEMECLNGSDISESIEQEWTFAIRKMIGFQPAVVPEVKGNGLRIVYVDSMEKEAFHIKNEDGIQILAGGEAGALYAVFTLLRHIQRQGDLHSLNMKEKPANPLRIINHWDNMDGSVERGYAGESMFYRDDSFRENIVRWKDYARLLASVGINAVSINNVNVHKVESYLITERYLKDVARVADIFRAYGIRLLLSINYASPMEVGGLTHADPLEEDVAAFWKQAFDDVYQAIPDFLGVVVKADSENRPGPFTYGRTHAEGANMLADAIAPHNGIVIWRCFVYDCHQDWRDRTTDRARAAYDHFMPLDGAFKDNVILQIKNGPMDFQVREPVSPLIGALKQTNVIVEFQLAQEYLGQQRHAVYLLPQWKEILNFDTGHEGEGTFVKDIASGKTYNPTHSGIAAVGNLGDDYNWTGHTLAQVNLYGYGRLTWDPTLNEDDILSEWSDLTFGQEEHIQQLLEAILLPSWLTYERYTSPLGIGWMINPGHHYGPNIDGYEYDAWGTYHFADRNGLGVDRTVETGTGYTSQYAEQNAKIYNDPNTCPEELLLFFHHMPYNYELTSGKTIIQHIYDTHFEGVKGVESMVANWEALEGKIDDKRFSDVLERLKHQLSHAIEWRDIINTYFYRKSGIKDIHQRKIYE